jgi:K+ transporter
MSIAPGELSDHPIAKTGRTALAVSGVAALGIVFGDIGTSPL